jgi:hypothetical protein
MRPFSGLAMLLCPAVSIAAVGQTSQPIPIQTAQGYFAEAQSICEADRGQLWGVSLCGPIMFVDPATRSIVANQPDTQGALKAANGVFVGVLPTDQNIANTAVQWSGVHWTQILWPLPEDEHQRDTLMGHELFHRIQDQLRLPDIKGGDNAQLDTIEGRYLLQLEERALARALEANTDADRRQAVEDALVFRAQRYSLFPNAAIQEQALEMNEGLAEYTGVRLGNPTRGEQIHAALHDIAMQKDASTFVRSFAYATGPAYGLLLDRYAPRWHAELGSGGGFDVLLREAVHFSLPTNLQLATEQRAVLYDGDTLHAAEIERDARRQATIAGYRAKFLDGPVLTLRFQHMHVQFDPRNLQPLDKAGTVYPTMRVSDDWGVLTAKNGALMKPDWGAVIVAAPSGGSGANLQGDGWTLDLKPGWKIVSGAREGDFVLTPGGDDRQ